MSRTLVEAARDARSRLIQFVEFANVSMKCRNEMRSIMDSLSAALAQAEQGPTREELVRLVRLSVVDGARSEYLVQARALLARMGTDGAK